MTQPLRRQLRNGAMGQIVVVFVDSTSLEICLTLTDDTGCSSQNCQLFIIDNNPAQGLGYCRADFTADLEMDSTLVLTNDPFSTAVVSFRDENGRLYRSDWGPQPMESYFKVLTREPYERNENDQATQRLEIQTSCRVYDEQGLFVELSDLAGWWGVAHP